MKIKSERDFWAGLLFIVIGVAFAVAATYRDMGPACIAGDPCAASLAARFALMSAHPGPGFFPLGLGVVLALLGAAVLFKSLAIESFGGEPITPIAWRPVAGTIASLLLFASLLDPLGLVAVVTLTVLVASSACEGVRWRGVFVHAALCGAGAWLLFVRFWPLGWPAWPWFVR